MPRIIHAADIHLDSPLQGLGRLCDASLATELRAATRRAYDNLLQLCVDEKADLLVIAGDIYDGDWRSYETGEYFVRGLRRLRDNGVEVALLYGNHDAESSITKRLTMPDGVRVLSTSEPESVEFPDLGVVVHGQGYAVRDVLENLAQHYPHRRDGFVNVGVLHTGVQGIAGHARYAPCTIEDLTACEYEYFALGHIHERGELAGGYTPVWFSGNLQGRHPRETGPKGALVVDIEPDGPAHVRFAECDVARWETLEPGLAACANVEDVIEAMAAEYQTALGRAGDRPLVVRFRLHGQTPAAAALVADPDRLLAEARSLVRSGSAIDKVVLDVSPPVSSPTLDSELAAQVTKAAHALAEDPDTVRQILGDLRRFGLWRLTRDTEIDLDADETLVSLVQRAGRRLNANLGA
ncbi:DNA repair exonuclease [Mycolicibacterium sp. P9-64]|uniref:metallophosphoesterase family protein n=1 Tax=Mycolicibacterium sp. P9-64 TaxID=2024612 RepID=UPI0011EFACD5|nr:DNA repair exonuclease [Mycolicibacterium sp. P9-64]KAA0086687.1 DNA repair exonuclease [Mycolicibacterium sp. P9-64]